MCLYEISNKKQPSGPIIGLPLNTRLCVDRAALLDRVNRVPKLGPDIRNAPDQKKVILNTLHHSLHLRDAGVNARLLLVVAAEPHGPHGPLGHG